MQKIKDFIKSFIEREYGSTEIVKRSIASAVIFSLVTYTFLNSENPEVLRLFLIPFAIVSLFYTFLTCKLIPKDKENRVYYIIGLIPAICQLIAIPIILSKIN